uniref:Uncharacterized protein n=1 Tax=Rhodosorus marinus TaxID=101924 RepID=A0A7S3A397_9RHOD|mmetsp:Transcript_41854/g.164095  ORF Transcript_41854/g.164095 Transcript_41854/m.164095 type:complete len:337 (+) Transcript_41854:263-1273(+)
MAPRADAPELLEYCAPWPVYSLAWSHKEDKPFRLAMGSFVNESKNFVRVVSFDEQTRQFEEVCDLPHSFPATKVGFSPDSRSEARDFLASTGDCLRIWEVKEGSIGPPHILKTNQSSEFCAPLTSFDWNTVDRSLLGVSSIDTTCTVWNVETQQVKNQLIAHDREVYDFAFAKGPDLFASAGADGSVRLFDLRSLDYSTIIYESEDQGAMMRVCWNKNNAFYLATVMMESPKCVVLDIRVPDRPVCVFEEGDAEGGNFVNSIAWAPRSEHHICTAGESGRAIIWNISGAPERAQDPVLQPLLSYDAHSAIDNVQWSEVMPAWIAFATGTSVNAVLT